MTFEELKTEATKQGYNLVKKPTYIPMAKCPCGAKLSIKAKWTVYGNAYYCIKCGLESNPSKTQKGARENWNKAVETYKAIDGWKGEDNGSI